MTKRRANAEAQPDVEQSPTSLGADGVIAGAAEVARRELDADDVHAIVLAERDARVAAADDLGTKSASSAADQLRARQHCWIATSSEVSQTPMW